MRYGVLNILKGMCASGFANAPLYDVDKVSVCAAKQKKIYIVVLLWETWESLPALKGRI